MPDVLQACEPARAIAASFGSRLRHSPYDLTRAARVIADAQRESCETERGERVRHEN